MFDILLSLMGAFLGLLQQPLTKNFIQLAIWVGGAWLIGLLLLPFVFDSLWGVVARHFLSGLLQQNLIVESLPWRTWLKPIAVVQLAVAAPFVVTVAAIPASALVILIYFVIVIPFLVRYVWQWACREIFPNAVASGLVSPNITWTVGFALLFLWFISSLLASLPNIAMLLLEIIKKTSS